MDGRMEYSILKEKIKENECGWSKTVHTGTAIPTAPGHGGMVVSLFTVHSPAAGDCKSDTIVPLVRSNATSSVIRDERYA
jgi:hypothetical protein